jgi:hypothetical protein
MTILPTTRVSVPDDVLVRELGEEGVLLNLGNETYYGLDAVGMQMWKLLTTTPTVQAAHEALLAQYDVPADVLQQDLLGLIDRLAAQGLLKVE